MAGWHCHAGKKIVKGKEGHTEEMISKLSISAYCGIQVLTKKKKSNKINRISQVRNLMKMNTAKDTMSPEKKLAQTCVTD